jgi:hypothetical protein
MPEASVPHHEGSMCAPLVTPAGAALVCGAPQVFLRAQRLFAMLFLMSSVYGLGVLLPINLRYDEVPGHFSRTTMANIPNKNKDVKPYVYRYGRKDVHRMTWCGIQGLCIRAAKDNNCCHFAIEREKGC